MPLPFETRIRIVHALIAFKLFAESWSHFDKEEPLLASLILLFALLLAAYAIFHPRLHHWKGAGHLETGVFLIETVVLAFTTIGYFEHGKIYLPWISLAATIFYLLLALRQHRINLKAAPKATS